MFKNSKKEILITTCLLLVTTTAAILFYRQVIFALLSAIDTRNISNILPIAIFIVISFFILSGNFIYHLTRLGHYLRLSKHKKISPEELSNFLLKKDLPTVTYLIPSYKEEPKVIQQTMWSAALQNYVTQKIVLLIDNPPYSKNDKDKALLEETRNIPIKMQSQFDEMKKSAEHFYQTFQQNVATDKTSVEKEVARISNLYDKYHSWLESNLLVLEPTSHVDTFFFKSIYLNWFEVFRSESENWKLKHASDTSIYKDITAHYIRLIGILNVEFSSFERKKYVNLNHEPNKAMNLNSYLHLIGKKIRTFTVDNLNYLEITKDPTAPIQIPDSKYVLNLDADSILLPDYTVKLVYEMEKEGNKKVAVIQTPYSAYPGATSPIEKVAGATTDMQYNIHQGFTYYSSTYWVGANAMLRKQALEDLRMYEVEGTKVSPKYIQDRTVIEDTESSIDLVKKGWKLFNYPERLAYSSTPPDFGSLIIQRERWANGGLIIFPKLIKYLFQSPFSIKRWIECTVRANYLTSIAGVNLGTLLLLMYPFGDSVFTWWLPISSVPYYFLYTVDLKKMGYRFSDVIRVYALNLILIPINIAGVLKSIQQGLTGKKIPFKRTPKIGDRVAAEVKFIVFEYVLLLYVLAVFIFDIYLHQWTHASYSFVNFAILFYAIATFIGFTESWEDVKAQLASQEHKFFDMFRGTSVLK